MDLPLANEGVSAADQTETARIKAPALKLPGHEGVWILIFGDMLIFALFFGTFLYYRGESPDLYAVSQAKLNEQFGLLNTFLLLTSSWFVVCALHLARLGKALAARRNILAAMLLGIGFCVSKMFEYAEKVSEGHTLISDEFFMFYFMFTGIHLVHVLIGLGALLFLYLTLRKTTIGHTNVEAIESVGAFWHLVDLLWVILFALLYLTG